MFHWGMILSKKCQKPAVHKKGGLAILGGCLEKRGSNLMQTMNVLATKTQSTYIYDRKVNKIKRQWKKPYGCTIWFFNSNGKENENENG